MTVNGIALVDSNVKRRAEIAHLLRAKGVHIEPYESVSDYEAYPVQAALYLVADEGELVGQLLNAHAVRDQFPSVIAYGETPCVDRIVEAMRQGAANYIIWPFEDTILELTFGALAVGRTNVAMIRSRVLRAKRKLECLTERELQVLELITQGHSSKEVGGILQISPRTVEIHRANMMAKLDVKNVAQLVRLAVESSIEEETGAILEAA